MLLCYVIDSGLSTSLLLLATLIIIFYIYITLRLAEIGAKKPVGLPENRYHKPARKRSTVLFVTENWYQKNSVPNCMSDAPETGTGFLVLVFGADLWYMCYWHNFQHLNN